MGHKLNIHTVLLFEVTANMLRNSCQLYVLTHGASFISIHLNVMVLADKYKPMFFFSLKNYFSLCDRAKGLKHLSNHRYYQVINHSVLNMF